MSFFNKKTALMKAEALLCSVVLACLKKAGPVRASDIAGKFCRLLGPFLPPSKIADRNLQMAMPELTSKQRQDIIRGVWENLGRTAGEFPHLSTLRENTPEGQPGYEVQGAEHLKALPQHQGPVLFVSGHIGNWEMLPPAVARYGTPFASFYRAAGNRKVDAMIRSLRDAAMGPDPVPLFAKGAEGARAALRYVAKGGRLGMLVDQKMNDGIEARLFGLPAMTAPALASMALKYRCPVIPGYVVRLGPARLRIVVEPPMVLPQTGDKQQDLATLVQMINDRLESWVRQKPESWLWLHRRWPKSLYRKTR